MAGNTLVPLRRAIVAALKADAGVTALVPPARIYQPETPAKPTWPFIRYGTADRAALVASCLDGSTVRVALHGFAKGPGDDKAAAIGAAIAACLDGPDGKGLVLALEGGAVAHLSVSGERVVPDRAEASAWHAIVDVEATVVN